MYNRVLNIDSLKNESIFLFGARQTGKSTLLVQRFPDAVYFDLLKTNVLERFLKRPALLREMLQDKPADTVVIIDEIQQAPVLLNEVHWLMTNKNLRFILCGSSARKLKRSGDNTLGGRAVPCYLYPLVSAEIPDFDLDCALKNGMLPRHYTVSDASHRLRAYIDVYLKEEIQQESIVRNLQGFSRFLEVAAISNGEIINYQNVATDCGVSANTVKEYFSILQDTLIGYLLPAYTKTLKRRLVQAPRFYFFDVGVANYLLGRSELKAGTVEYGHVFEHFVIQELRAYIGYHNQVHPLRQVKMSYWRTYSGIEVDVVLGDAEVALEIKSAAEIQSKHLKGLLAFAEEYPSARLLVVSLDEFSRKIGSVENLYIHDFLKALWQGGII